ncbi:hypothetical protein V1522DRAFT_452656 [Lipomyces starkeyi]
MKFALNPSSAGQSDIAAISMPINSFSRNNPFTGRRVHQQPIAAASNSSVQQQIDTERGAASSIANIDSPPPAYIPAWQTQRDLEANIPPAYEPVRDRSTYTDNVPLQDLRPVDGLRPLATATSIGNDDATLFDYSKPKFSVWDQSTTKKGMAYTLVVFFAISAVLTLIGMIPLLMSASHR